MKNLTTIAAVLGAAASTFTANADVIASDSFGGALQPIVYTAGPSHSLYVPQSGSGNWSTTWFTSSNFNVQNSNLSHQLSPAAADGYSIGGPGIPGTAARRTFAAQDIFSYSFLSQGSVLFDVSGPDYWPVNITYSADNNGSLVARMTNSTNDGGWNDTFEFNIPGVQAAQTVMTVVQFQQRADNTRNANIWILPDNVTNFPVNQPTLTLANVLQQPSDRIVINTYNGGKIDGIAIGENLSDVVHVPTPGSLALIAAGLLIAARRHR